MQTLRRISRCKLQNGNGKSKAGECNGCFFCHLYPIFPQKSFISPSLVDTHVYCCINYLIFFVMITSESAFGKCKVHCTLKDMLCLVIRILERTGVHPISLWSCLTVMVPDGPWAYRRLLGSFGLDQSCQLIGRPREAPDTALSPRITLPRPYGVGRHTSPANWANMARA